MTAVHGGAKELPISRGTGGNPNLARFNDQAEGYEQVPERLRRAQAVARKILELGLLSPQARVLDVGCGTGLLTLEVHGRALSVTAVDLSPRMLDTLREKCAQNSVTNVEPVAADLEREPLPGGDYHLIMSSMTLHHVQDPYALLQRCFEALQPGGALAVADLEWDATGFHPDPRGVVHQGFERRDLVDQFLQVGFTGVETATVSGDLRPLPGGGEKRFTTFLIWGKRP